MPPWKITRLSKEEVAERERREYEEEQQRERILKERRAREEAEENERRAIAVSASDQSNSPLPAAPEALTNSGLVLRGQDAERKHGVMRENQMIPEIPAQAGRRMTWAEYQASARVFGSHTFQSILPARYVGPLPEPTEVERSAELRALVDVAWEVHEEGRPRSLCRSQSRPPDTEPCMNVRPYEPGTHAPAPEWTPFQSVWPDTHNPTYVVWSNRRYAPPVPPPIEQLRLRDNARYGIHERHWLPQLDETDAESPHLAFIPMMPSVLPGEEHVVEKQDAWFFKTHQDPKGDIAWYLLREEHLVRTALNLWQLGPSLRSSVRQGAVRAQLDWNVAYQERSQSQFLLYHWQKHAPIDMVHATGAAFAYLMGESGTEWDLRCALVGFQRGVLEMRGWAAYCNALHKAGRLADFAPPRRNTLEAHADAMMRFSRRDSRGVFVRSPAMAAAYAQFDVPVWYCQPYKSWKPEKRINSQARVLPGYGSTEDTDSIVEAVHPSGIPSLGYLALAKTRARVLEEERLEKERVMAFRKEEERRERHEELRLLAEKAELARQHAEKVISQLARRRPGGQKDEVLPVATPPVPSASTGGRSHTMLPSCAPGTKGELEAGEISEEGKTPQVPVSAGEPITAMPTASLATSSATLVHQEDPGSLKRKEPPEGQEEMPGKRPRKRGRVLRDVLGRMGASDLRAVAPIRLTTSAAVPKRNLPEWWPTEFCTAVQCRELIDKSREREVRLVMEEYSVPQAAKGKKAVFKMPPLAYFENAWATEKREANKTKLHNVYRSLFRWLQIRPYYLAKVGTDAIGEDDGFEKDDWRRILKACLLTVRAPEIIKRLGLDVACVNAGAVEIGQGLRPLLDGIKEFLSFDGYPLPAPDVERPECWLPIEWVQYIIWELAELEFRYEMLSLALFVRREYPDKADLQELSDVEYFNNVKESWSAGTQAIKPSEQNWLCSPDPAKRVPALRSFAQVMRAWPRAAAILKPWDVHWEGAAEVPRVDSDEFGKLERAVWECYLQSYYDYRGRVAPVPYNRPVPPFEENSPA